MQDSPARRLQRSRACVEEQGAHDQNVAWIGFEGCISAGDRDSIA